VPVSIQYGPGKTRTGVVESLDNEFVKVRMHAASAT
jgi:hypothetical protein